MLSTFFKNVCRFKGSVCRTSDLMLLQSQINQTQLVQAANVYYGSTELWKSVLLVSNQGSKKGRGKRRGGGRVKDLNAGQSLGDGKMQVVWPGLNADIKLSIHQQHQHLQQTRDQSMKEGEEVKSEVVVGDKFGGGLVEIEVRGLDENREQRLTEIRNQMDKFKSITIAPHERGFTGNSLNGKKLGPPAAYDDVDFGQFETVIVKYRAMIAMKSILGKKKTISCFAITGNRNGIIGYGTGKGPTARGALNLARAHASQRLLAISRYEDRTLFHDFYEEYYHTKVYAEKKPKGFGLVCHRLIKQICLLIGIKDIYVKVEGSRNEANMVKAFLSGLLNQKKYADIANAKGLFVVEFKQENNGFPTVLAAPDKYKDERITVGSAMHSFKDKEEQINEDEYENEYLRDFNLFLFQNKSRAEKKKKLPFYYHDPAYKQYCKLRDKHNSLKRSRIERIKQLSDDVLNETKYPMKPKPKSNTDAAQTD